MSSEVTNKSTTVPSTDGGGEALQASNSSESQERQSAVIPTISDMLQQIESSADPKPQETESGADSKPQQPATTAPIERAGQDIRTVFTQQQGGSNEAEMIDFCSAERITLVRKIRIPHPSFKGSIIGRGGETITAMRKTYQCKLHVLGAGSTKDGEGERALLESGAEEHQHLAEPLHVKIECSGPASVVYPRVQAAMEIFNQLFNDGNATGMMGAQIQTQTPQQRHVPPPIHCNTPAPFNPQQGYRARMTDAMAMDVSVPPPLQRPQRSVEMGHAMGRVTTSTGGGGGAATHSYRGGVQKRERPSTVGQGTYHQQQGQQTRGAGQSGGRGGTSDVDYSNPMRGRYGSSGGGRGGGSDYSNPMRGGYGSSGGGRGGSSQTRGGPNPSYRGRGGASYH